VAGTIRSPAVESIKDVAKILDQNFTTN
jgi:hypothetical protein